jgi:hypothetical protein
MKVAAKPALHSGGKLVTEEIKRVVELTAMPLPGGKSLVCVQEVDEGMTYVGVFNRLAVLGYVIFVSLCGREDSSTAKKFVSYFRLVRGLQL